MRARNAVNGLAIAGALVALVGVILAASDALAADMDTIDSTGVAIHEVCDRAVTGAAVANVEAAEEAVSALELDNVLDVEIELIGHTS